MLENGYILRNSDREYKVLEFIGRGANTAAYLAECRYSGLATKCILKEYSPQEISDFESGKARFISAGKMQNEIRQRSALNNQTPPVSHIFEANDTAYIDVACFGGTTLDKLTDLTLSQYIAICRTIAKTVGYYHKSGLLCLDLKPENIFVLQNAPDDTITELVEFIDFDSVRDKSEIHENSVISYTKNWAAPEQTAPFGAARVSPAADIFTVGELVFYLLFGRHSTDSEHRGFSKYPFCECRKVYRRFTERPDIQSLFVKLFRGTIRSSATNRFSDISEVVKILDKLVTELERRDYIIPKFPSVSPNFTGRDNELHQIANMLENDRVVFVTGIGGIGKSSFVKNYISRNKASYDVIAYLEFDGDIKRAFADDTQLQISTLKRMSNESVDDYYVRKLSHFKEICGEKRVLFVLDNFSGRITNDLSCIIDCGYDTVIVTRNLPPKNSFAFMEIGAISDKDELFRLITLNLERQLTKDERLCFDEIIDLVQGHTLVLELIARQIAAGRLNVREALNLIRENGFSHFSAEKIGNYKDGEEVYDTLSAIIYALFKAVNISEDEQIAMKVLSLLNVRGLEHELVNNLLSIENSTLSSLAAKGWLTDDNRVKIHPVIAETVRSWEWTGIEDVSVMKQHKNVIDIYVGMSNVEQIKAVLKEAEKLKNNHPRHIINALFFDMQGSYYDTLLDGNYVPYTEQEAELIENMIEVMGNAIDEMEQSSDSRKNEFLMQYYLSMASILIRSVPEYYDEAARYIAKAEEMVEQTEPEYSPNRCYLAMVKAWYFTLAEPDFAETKALTEYAAEIAEKVFPTELEIIDIAYIPTANCYYYHGQLKLAVEKLEEAVKICCAHTDSLPYIDKQAELLNCQLDVYFELGEKQKCREIITKIDNINEKYNEQGICREVSPEIREQII